MWGAGYYEDGSIPQIPGTYINLKVTPNPNYVLGERGYLAIPMELDWGLDEQVMTVTADDYVKKAQNYFGYRYGAEELKFIDEMFKNAHTLYIYRTNSGEKATGKYGTAKCSGELGNTISIVVEENPDYEEEDD